MSSVLLRIKLFSNLQLLKQFLISCFECLFIAKILGYSVSRSVQILISIQTVNQAASRVLILVSFFSSIKKGLNKVVEEFYSCAQNKSINVCTVKHKSQVEVKEGDDRASF